MAKRGKSGKKCVACDAEIALASRELKVGDYVICVECGTEYRVERVSPIELRGSDTEAESSTTAGKK